jgi:hypothetical protein
MILNRIFLLGLICFSHGITAQNLPDQWRIDPYTHMVVSGDQMSKGIYDESTIEVVRLYFSQSNYWTLLTQNYNAKVDLMCRMEYKGVTYDSIGVRFKGQTSYFMNNSQKKSFNITMDAFKDGGDLGGYNTLNLNNSFDDPSMMREVLYYHMIRNHTPSAKANWVVLYINDVSWGLYQNVQQLNKDFLKEWYTSAKGINMRADAPGGFTGGGGAGPGWGDGTAGFNYLGEDTTQYQKYYTLKSTDASDTWQQLIAATKILKQSTNLEVDAPKVIDIDKTLWHLACENLFGDDDSYIYKGKMDYYLYQEPTLDRWATYDYDANSTFVASHATWSPFYNETKVNYPLLNKLLAVPSFRQRYLAHLRTINQQFFNPNFINPLIDSFDLKIKSHVLADTKKTTSNTAYTSAIPALKKYAADRRTTFNNNAEFKLESPVITDVKMKVNDQDWGKVRDGDVVTISLKATHSQGIKSCNLYLGKGIITKYTVLAMNDSGTNGDATSGDGIFSVSFTDGDAGDLITFYTQAIANNAAGTTAFFPQGTEHQMLAYTVQGQNNNAPTIVINEFMSSNKGVIKDENNETEDWIELYNTTSNAINIGGYVLTDDDANLDKYVVPEGTVMAPNSYLIIWADEDGTQGPYHANFKLSATGEKIILLDKSKNELDRVEYGPQQSDLSSARKPNGTGAFVIGQHTFNANNDVVGTDDELTTFNIRPNPAQNMLYIDGLEKEVMVNVYTLLGQQVVVQKTKGEVDISELNPGTYIILIGKQHLKFVKM